LITALTGKTLRAATIVVRTAFDTIIAIRGPFVAIEKVFVRIGISIIIVVVAAETTVAVEAAILVIVDAIDANCSSSAFFFSTFCFCPTLYYGIPDTP